MVTPVRRPDLRRHAVVCPKPSHGDGVVHFRGRREGRGGLWMRYQCRRPTGDRHYFRILTGGDDSVVTSLAPPPECADHEGAAKVTRYGWNGTGAARRQRYRCVPDDGSAVHYFTPKLPRQVVDVGGASCPSCDELLSPHHGPRAGARHTPWLLDSLAQSLVRLAAGDSYAAASMELRRRRTERTEQKVDDPWHVLGLVDAADVSMSWTAREGRNAWHLAGDLVEQYSPLFWQQACKQIRDREISLRAANDRQLAGDVDSPLAHPIVYLLDKQSVRVNRFTRAAAGHQSSSWALLVVTELVWHDAGPQTLPLREPRLRLVRAYPNGDEAAWRLVLHELGTRPDFIVSDNDASILNAVNGHYGKGTVGLVPSLFHFHRNIREALLKLPHTSAVVDGRAVLADPLRKQLRLARRDDALPYTPRDWADWWDELIDEVERLGAPCASVWDLRAVHESRIADGMALVRRHPQLPASNAAVEAQIRQVLDPFLENRGHLYRNLARTNMLMDLAVCRSQGLLTDERKVAADLRKFNEDAGGWAPQPRLVTDHQPPSKNSRAKGGPQLYASLLNPLLVPALAEQRGARRAS